MSKFLAAHKPWERSAWTFIEVVVAAIPVAALHLPLVLVAPVGAGIAYIKSTVANKVVKP